MSEQEIRTDFAGRLVRLFEAMGVAAGCLCGAKEHEHRIGCPIYQWAAAARMTQMVLDQENGVEGG